MMSDVVYVVASLTRNRTEMKTLYLSVFKNTFKRENKKKHIDSKRSAVYAYQSRLSCRTRGTDRCVCLRRFGSFFLSVIDVGYLAIDLHSRRHRLTVCIMFVPFLDTKNTTNQHTQL